MEIEIISVIDFYAYFESMVKSSISKITNPNIKRIFITAGPFRPYGSAFEWISKNEVHLDFYAATRVGFGSIDLDGLLRSLNTSDYVESDNGHILGHSLVMEKISYGG